MAAFGRSAVAGGNPYLQVIFDSLPLGVVVQDPAGKIIAVNPRAESILGLSLAQMEGVTSIDPAWRALHEDGSPFPGSAHPAMEALRSGQAVNDVVMGIFNPTSGAHTWINVSATPIRHPTDTRSVAVYSVFQDITRQKLAEKELLDRNAEFRVAVETSSDGFWVVNMQGQLLEVNDAYARMSGYSKQELHKLVITDLDAFDRQDEVLARTQRIVQTGNERFVTVHRTKDGARWPVEVVAAYSAVAGGRLYCFIKDLTEQQNSAELIWHQANFDRLTDLPNRALFFDRLSQECSAARRSGRIVALLFADLDAFKAVNDNHGHDAGDLVLKTVASRWLACVRSTDTIARLGGDEFAIIVGNLEASQEAATVASKLVAALREPIALPGGKSCSVGVSVGIALYPANAREMDSLLQAADQAMYACKAGGRNAFGYDDWIAFTEAHLVGVAEIDAQHRQLVSMVNGINREISVNADDVSIDARFDALIDFTVQHFQTEHRFMTSYHYPGIQSHAAEHAQLTSELRQIVKKRGHDGDLLVLQKIKDWLMSHIHGADKALGTFLNQEGVR